ncbi:MFS transporter [Candidimonas humi]|uniref:MFS transporter n=1 Tax=Candidimonas humi TaxID=683355 RepID=A0ABV8P5J9_9BURK|nr:MFS transporter [Candidimonas humi]MBV6307307.1 MFS transporter [Candidimonas humi]
MNSQDTCTPDTPAATLGTPSGREPGSGIHPVHPARESRILVLAALCLAVLVAQIDTAVVNLGMNPMAVYFKVDVRAMQWVADAYNLVYAVMLLTGGLLADLYGRRKVFVAGAALFTAASVLCGCATSMAPLVAGRALAGMGAALMIPASLAILRVVWHDETERARALGIWSGCNGLAFAIAPALGGLAIAWMGWRSIFFLVVPVGTGAIALALRAVPESSAPQGRRFDLAAQMLSAAALGMLALSAIEASHNRALAWGSLAISVLAGACFIRVEATRGASAMVPLRIFRQPVFRGAIAATSGMTFGMYGLLFLLPMTWQATHTLDAMQAGLALMPMALAFVLVSSWTGRLAEIIGTHILTCGGVAIIGAGLLAVGASAGSSSVLLAQAGLLMAGIGMGLATGPLMGAAIGAVPAAQSGIASALINVARMAGATLGVAVLGAIYAAAADATQGLRLAMYVGGCAQLACALAAWPAIRAGR